MAFIVQFFSCVLFNLRVLMLTTQCTPWFNIVLLLISLQNDILNSIVYGVYKLKPVGSFPKKKKKNYIVTKVINYTLIF